MSISPLPPKSNEPSRPASPAADALEVLSLDEEAAISPSEDVIRMKANSNRKTSSWKGFKSQFTKAEMKIKSTFGDSFAKERKAVDGTIISPVELSPDSIEDSAQSSSPENEPAEKFTDLIRNIEELGAECDKEIAAKTMSNSSCAAVVEKKDRRVDFAVEESPCRKASVPPSEGAGISRPTELPFGSKNDIPIAPPRAKKEKRLERLLSVPNIKLNKQDQNRLLNLRKTSQVEKSSALSTSSSTAATASSSKSKGGNFMRRFSKYQFTCINQSINHYSLKCERVCMLFIARKQEKKMH
jgi:hypothetical protein